MKCHFLCVPLLCAIFCLSTPANSQQDEDNYDVQALEICNQPNQGVIAYVILNDQLNTLNGWNHIRLDKPSGEYQSLNLSDDDYAISTDNYLPDVSCDGIKTQNSILVIKLNDWTQQHANGLETTIRQDDLLYFKDITHISMDLRINKDKTTIPSLSDLHQKYDQYLTPEQFKTFDNAKVNLGITLFEEGATDQTSESLNATQIVEIDQDQYFDQWLRVTIPIEGLTFFLEQNYASQPTSYNQQLNKLIHGFRLTAENSFGKQVRNYLGEQWGDSIAETFKEISISLRRIELIKIPTDKHQVKVN